MKIPAPLESLSARLRSLPEDAVEAQEATARTLAGTIRDSLGEGSLLRDQSFLMENWQWVGLLALIALGLVFDRFSAAVLRRLARKAVEQETIKLDEQRLTGVVRPIGTMITWWVFVTLLPALDIQNPQVVDALSFLGSVILSVAAVVAAWRTVNLFCDFLHARAAETQNKFDDMLVPLLRRTLKIFVVVAGVAYVASKGTGDIWKIVAGASIGGAILALAFKDSVENIFGTFTVLLDKPFQLGDWITVGDVDGTVERVGFRSTRVRTFYNSLISVPNRHFISATVDNWGARRYRRIKTTLSVSYSTPPEKLEAFCEGVREVIRHHPYTRKDYYHVYFNDFGASSLNVMLYCFVEVPDWSVELRERHRLLADILRVAEQLGVEFAFPTQTLHMIQGEPEVHADRPGSDQDGASLGRKVGAEVARASLAPFGDAKPGKVKFIQASSPLAAPGSEADG